MAAWRDPPNRRPPLPACRLALSAELVDAGVAEVLRELPVKRFQDVKAHAAAGNSELWRLGYVCGATSSSNTLGRKLCKINLCNNKITVGGGRKQVGVWLCGWGGEGSIGKHPSLPSSLPG